MNPTEWGLLVLLSVLWGSAFFLVGLAVIELPPLTVALARVGIASLVLLALISFLGHPCHTACPNGPLFWSWAC